MTAKSITNGGKAAESLADLVARVRRSGCDEADLGRLCDASAELVRRMTVERTRRRKWRIRAKSDPVLRERERARQARSARRRRAALAGSQGDSHA
jgi:hypothetical protein